MNWNRIETKWHEMARRLQQGGTARAPSGGDGSQLDPGPTIGPTIGPDSTSQDRPDIPTGRAPDETAARVAG